MKRNVYLLSILVLLHTAGFASIDTISIYSNSMFKNVNCVVITPSVYQMTSDRFPVVYLLHGYSDNYATWVKRVPELQSLADENKLMIVCPDGAYSSWYFDSPSDLNMHYETNISAEIPRYIDSVYRTIANRKGRAITGLSMGGHGGLFLGFRHSQTFGACGSMSGGLDLNPIKKQYGIEKALGDTSITNNTTLIGLL